ncbi:hypothetical protein V8J88_24605 [Massilia sp. W12]
MQIDWMCLILLGLAGAMLGGYCWIDGAFRRKSKTENKNTQRQQA